MARPNPTQLRDTDYNTTRRELKAMLPATRILDKQEADEILDLSYTGHRMNALRLRLLRYALNQLPTGMMLSAQEREALTLYREGRGPRPPFTLFTSPDGHYGASYLASDDPDALQPAPPGPEQDPSEPGRYVAPSGRFALPGTPGWSADTR